MLQNPYKTAETILFASSKPRGKLKSVDLYGPSVKEKNEGSLCSTFHLENESGTGDIAAYSVFPGMELVYNDMHMKYCNKTAKSSGRTFLKLIIAERGGLNVFLENIVIVT